MCKDGEFLQTGYTNVTNVLPITVKLIDGDRHQGVYKLL